MDQKDDAIQTDVSAEQTTAADTATTEATERPKSQREIDMEAAEARRRTELVEEGVAVEAPKAETDVDSQIEQQAADAAASIADQVADASKSAAAVAAAVEPAMVKVKVNGVEELVPLDKVVAQYQKSSAADKRLEEATRLVEEARAMHAQATTTTDKKVAAEKIAEAQATLDAQKDQFFKSIFDGDREHAQEALDKIITESVATALKGREQPATPDEASIIAKVTPAVKQQLAVDSALTQFRKDFPKIASDPYLASRADAFVDAALALGKSHEDAFKEAGPKTLDWMRDTLGIKTTVTVSTARTEKAARKAEIDNPSAASAKTTIPEAPVEQNVASTIADMRKQRITG